MNLNYRYDHRKTGYPPIMLFNGIFASLKSWDGLVEKNKEYPFLRYDHRGLGKSPECDESYGLEEQAFDALSVMDHCDVPFVYALGISNGARVAMKCAELFPQRIKALVVADTYAKPSELLKLKLQSWIKAVDLGGPEHRFDMATPWIWGESTIQNNPDLVNTYRSKADLISSHASKVLLKEALEGEIDLRSISCPSSVLVGEEDVLTPPFLHFNLARQLGTEMRLIKGGHASLLEYPENFDLYVRPFLREHYGMD